MVRDSSQKRNPRARVIAEQIKKKDATAERGWRGGALTLDEKFLPGYFLPVRELVFEVTQEEDGGFWAECLSDTVVTEGDNWDELRKNVQEVVRAFYFDEPSKVPTTVRLHLVRDEVLAVA